jgi:hypothetical protein
MLTPEKPYHCYTTCTPEAAAIPGHWTVVTTAGGPRDRQDSLRFLDTLRVRITRYKNITYTYQAGEQCDSKKRKPDVELVNPSKKRRLLEGVEINAANPTVSVFLAIDTAFKRYDQSFDLFCTDICLN